MRLAVVLLRVFEHRDIAHVWANTVALACALLGFNAMAVLRRSLGEGELKRIFWAAPPLEETPGRRPRATTARRRG